MNRRQWVVGRVTSDGQVQVAAARDHDSYDSKHEAGEAAARLGSEYQPFLLVDREIDSDEAIDRGAGALWKSAWQWAEPLQAEGRIMTWKDVTEDAKASWRKDFIDAVWNAYVGQATGSESR